MTVGADQAVVQAWDIRRSFAGQGAAFTLHIDRLSVRRGDRVAVTGPSGCGKSTLLAVLAGALAPDQGGGGLRLMQGDLLALWRDGGLDALARLRGVSLGFVPQTAALLPFLTLRANIALPLAILGRSDPGRVEELAGALGLDGQLAKYPAQLSVGQRQRAAIARALVHRPAIVLADEPTAAVHPAQAEAILALLTQEAARTGAAIILVTHDAERAARAGYALAPCALDEAAPLTHFTWLPG